MQKLLTCLVVLASLLLVGITPDNLNAQKEGFDLFWQSATVGEEGQTSGIVVNEGTLLGAKFEVDEQFILKASSGHVGLPFDTGDIYFEMFVAVVELDPVTELPRSVGGNPFTSEDVLDVRVFAVRFPSQAYFAEHENQIVLDPGKYGIVFGSGYFGTFQSAILPGPDVNPTAQDIGNPEYFKWENNQWVDGGFNRIHFGISGDFVNAVPEPGSLGILGSLVLIGAAGRRRRKK